MSTIAAQHGFGSAAALYEHPDNEQIRAIRPNPDILWPGDEVVIPESAGRRQRIRMDARHVFVRVQPRVFLRLRVPRELQASFSIELEDHDDTFEGAVQDGLIDVEIPITARNGRLVLTDGEGDVIEAIHLRIGDLDPVDCVTGIQSRLRRLGYDCGDEVGEFGPATRRSIAAFQRNNGLSDSGELDTPTQTKLIEWTGV